MFHSASDKQVNSQNNILKFMKLAFYCYYYLFPTTAFRQIRFEMGMMSWKRHRRKARALQTGTVIHDWSF